MNGSIPDGAKRILRVLSDAGYGSYIVGGCVRDLLLGKAPHDWDICTSAKPDETIAALDGMHIVKTGLKHGTVTVILEDGSYEVTTFRVDGVYKDNRHPENVRFVADIREDLARRDFTVNAMAYNETTGIIDPFGGMEDLKNGVIRCVGDARARFEEDALRIMRALRFSSTYGFSVGSSTSDAIHAQKDLLNNIANERINAELCKTLTGKGVLGVLTEYADVMQTVIPKFANVFLSSSITDIISTASTSISRVPSPRTAEATSVSLWLCFCTISENPNALRSGRTESDIFTDTPISAPVSHPVLCQD